MAVVLVRTYQRKATIIEQVVVVPIARFNLYQAAGLELERRMQKLEGGPRGQEQMDEVLKWWASITPKWQRWDG